MVPVEWSTLVRSNILSLKLFRIAGQGDNKKQTDFSGFYYCL